MAVVQYPFADSVDPFDNGYYGYIKDGELVIMERWGDQTSTLYHGNYNGGAIDCLLSLGRRGMKLRNSVFDYYDKLKSQK